MTIDRSRTQTFLSPGFDIFLLLMFNILIVSSIVVKSTEIYLLSILLVVLVLVTFRLIERPTSAWSGLFCVLSILLGSFLGYVVVFAVPIKLFFPFSLLNMLPTFHVPDLFSDMVSMISRMIVLFSSFVILSRGRESFFDYVVFFDRISIPKEISHMFVITLMGVSSIKSSFVKLLTLYDSRIPSVSRWSLFSWVRYKIIRFYDLFSLVFDMWVIECRKISVVVSARLASYHQCSRIREPSLDLASMINIRTMMASLLSMNMLFVVLTMIL